MKSGALCLALALLQTSCAWSLFSGNPRPDRSQPIALVEVRGAGPFLAAATSEGVLFLADEELEGPCRVRYFLGPDLVVDDGEVADFGGPFRKADIFLRTQAVKPLLRDVSPKDELCVLEFDGRGTRRSRVRLARDGQARGEVLAWPGRALPAGTPIFRITEDNFGEALQFVGLCTGVATLSGGEAAAGEARYITFAGPRRVREALANPRPMLPVKKPHFRPDGISGRR